MGVLGVVLVIVGIILLLAIIVVIWVVSGQKKLVHAEELVGNSLSQIGVQQASRWDALTALADMTKAYSDHEYHTLMEVIRARQGVGAKSSAAQVEGEEAKLQQVTAGLVAVGEAYPELRSNTVYLNTMNSVRDYENNVRMSRMVYNDTVTKYNRLVRSLPGSLVAGGLGFAPRDYLEADPAKENMPNMVR